MAARESVSPPAQALRYLEGARAVLELGSLAAAAPLLYASPRGDGHDVMVLPGMGGNDSSTTLLRNFLRNLGYRSHGWGLGTNLGLRRMGGLDVLLERASAIADTGGKKISVIGWSLGGVYARQLARAEPTMIRQVITMGSPINGDPRATAPWRMVEQSIRNRSRDGAQAAPQIDPEVVEAYIERNGPPPPGIPTTAIFSRSDGVVSWQIAMESPGPLTENIEVFGSHLGLGSNPGVWLAIADRLQMREGQFTRFNRSGWRQWMYGATGSHSAG